MTRIVVTGAGVMSPIGCSAGEFDEGVGSGAKGIDRIRNFETGRFPVSTGAEVRTQGAIVRTHHSVDRKSLFLEGAMEQLFRDTAVLDQYEPHERIMCLGAGIDYFDLVGYINSGAGRKGNWEEHYRCSNETIERLAARYRIEGGCFSNVSACVASTQAVGFAMRYLRITPHAMAVTGGFDSMLCHLHYMGFYKLGALSDWQGDPSGACRPYDRDRRGLVLGEGGVALLLQREEDADPARILAEVAGYGTSMDAYMVTDPDPEGRYLAQSALDAIRDAGLTPDDIDCVHVHGTGTQKNEPAETQAMKRIFGPRYRDIPVFSLKGQIGHLIGACGAMELLGVIHSLRTQQVMPTVNFSKPDPGADLRVIAGTAHPMKIQNVLKLNAAFGGQNTAIVMRKHENSRHGS